MENWHDIDKINEELGQSLDVGSSWEKFRGKEEKRKPFWLFFMGFFLLAGLAFLSLLVFYPMNSDQLTSEAIYSDVIPLTKRDKQKEASSKETKVITEARAIESEMSEQAANDYSSTKNEPIKRNQKSNTTNSQQDPKFEKASAIVSSLAINAVTKKNSSKNTTNSERVLNDSSPESDTKLAKINNGKVTNSNSILTSSIPLEILSNSLVWNTNTPGKLNDLVNQRSNNLKENFVHSSPSSSSTFSKTSLPWKIGLAYTYSNSSRSISNNPDAYAFRRQEKEDFLENNNFEFILQKNVSDHFFFQTGFVLDHTRVKNLETIQQVNFVELEDQIISIDVKNGITEAAQTGPLTLPQTNSTTYLRYQRYTNLSLPLLVGYELNGKRKWGMQIACGLNIQIAGTVSGETFDSYLPDGQYKDLESLDYRKTGLMQARAQLSLIRHLNKVVDFKIGLQYVQDLNGRRASSEASDERFQQVGIQVGLYRNL